MLKERRGKYKERIAENSRRWKNENKALIAEREKIRRSMDLSHRLKCNLRRRLNHYVSGSSKTDNTMNLIAASPEQLVYHLERQFKPGMSWDNYGRNGWHIDHIVPCNLFDFTKPEQQKSCFHYTNLQPLWGTDNIKKASYLEVCPV
jgi:hypothetical protein